MGTGTKPNVFDEQLPSAPLPVCIGMGPCIWLSFSLSSQCTLDVYHHTAASQRCGE